MFNSGCNNKNMEYVKGYEYILKVLYMRSTRNNNMYTSASLDLTTGENMNI